MTSTRIKALALAGLMTTMITVQDAKARGNPIMHDFMPLDLGNTWSYVLTNDGNLGEWTTGDRLGIEVQQVQVRHMFLWNDQHVYGLDNYGFGGGVMGNLHFFKDDHTMYEFYAGKTGCWYDWAAQPNFPVEIPMFGQDCIHGAIGVCTSVDPVRVPLGLFLNTVRIDYIERPCQDGGIVSDTFAAGVGLIRREEMSLFGVRTWELDAAVIGGIEYGNSLSALRTTPVRQGVQATVEDRTWGAIKATFVGSSQTASR